MKTYSDIEEYRTKAESILAQLDALQSMIPIDIPGRFVFSPPSSSRLIVTTLEELHLARQVLRTLFGWKDNIGIKFYSSGVVIATYKPKDDVKTPIPFEIWVEAHPDVFPKEILGNCKVEKVEAADYVITCPIKES